MPSHNLDIDARDLSEAPRLAKDSQSKGTMIGAGVAFLLFLAMLAYGSLPELSPQEIVAMEGYAGEQPTKHIFNIHSLEEAAEKEPVATVQKTMVDKTIVQQSNPVKVVEPEVQVAVAAPPVQVKPVVVEPVVVVEQPKPSAVTTIVVTEVANEQPVQEVATEAAIVVAAAPTPETVAAPVEIRAESSLFGTAPEKKVVAAMATTPTIDEAPDTVVVSSVAAIEPVPVPVNSSVVSQPVSKGKLLPLRSVLQDYTELKASPTQQSKTILSLGRGVVVTAFERHGKWIHIGTNDGSSITGFVLESSLGRVGTKNSG